MNEPARFDYFENTGLPGTPWEGDGILRVSRHSPVAELKWRAGLWHMKMPWQTGKSIG